jgi:iron complex outermembrane receptor protein
MKMNQNKSLFKIFLLLIGILCSASLLAQNRVQGTVTDPNHAPVAGAYVMVKGTTNGSVTDIDGRFSITNVDVNKDVITISLIGYKKVEIPVAGQSEVNVVLEEDTEILNQVVVIGYGTVKKKDATGSLSTVKADLDSRGLAPNAQDMLVGKVAGVTITNDGGSPTSGATIRIRGGSSLSASNDPLIIVDGVWMDNAGIGGVGNILSAINPNDIDSYTVLKDASATAIYGSRASNGVIIITTKKSTSSKLKITYDGNVSVSTRTNEIDVLNGDEYRAFITDRFTGASNEAEVLGKLGTANTDWQSEIFRTAINTEHNISMYGNVKESLPYRVSVGYTNINGILKTSEMDRYTASFVVNPSLFDDHLKVNLNGKGMYIENQFANTGAIGAAIAMDPTQPVYDANSPYGGYWSWIGNDGQIIKVATTNPLSMLEMRDDHSKVYNVIGSAQFDYALHYLPDLHFNLNLSTDYSKTDGVTYVPADAPSDYLYGGYDGTWDQKRNNSMLDFYTKYAKELTAIKSNFDIMGGYSWQHYWRESNNAAYRISKFDANGDPEVVNVSHGETENYLVSFFGRMNFNINDKYLFTATLRNDGSSRFSEENRWGVFPSAAFAWKISNENFLKNSGAINDLKLRLGWGKTGQQDINQGDYPYIGTYTNAINTQASYARGNEWIPVMRPDAYNPDLKWETTTTYNVGLDYAFLNNRINGAVDVYYRETTDLINAETTVAAGTNFREYVVANIGSLENKGIEFLINGAIIQKSNLKWDLGVNVAYNNNNITELSYGDNKSAIRRFGNTGGDGGFQLKAHKVGYASGMYYVYEQVYDEQGKPIEGMYVDRNGDDKINEDDLYLHHNSTPDWTFGFNTKLTFKQWDFSVNGHASLHNYNYNATASNNATMAQSSIYANEFLSNRPKSAFDTNFDVAQKLSDYYIQDASFLRIDNITLGWSFKQAFGSSLMGRVYTSVQNPVVFTKYSGLDPEVNGGVDSNFYPRPLTVMLGVNLNF